ncbi:hypothetical protein AX761_20895 [Rhizobium sp. 58]|nr:hypothetical protein AX761_20895 [Rhizobium sp. 58]
MTYPAWPVALPRPERQSWQATPQDARRRRRSDAGPVSYRRAFSSASRMVSMSVVLLRWQKSIFETFYEETVSGGSRLFTMPDPTTDGWPMLDSNGVAILDGGGVPVLLSKSWLCTFGEPTPIETIVGVRFRFSFAIEVMP